MAIFKRLLRPAQNEDGTQTLLIAGYNDVTNEGRIGRHTIADTLDAQAWFDDPPNETAILDALAAGQEDERVVHWFRFRQMVDTISNERDWIATTLPLIDAMTAQQTKAVLKRVMRQNRGMMNAIQAIARQILKDDRI